MPEFTYKPETHQGFLDGREIPSVTTVLPFLYYGDNEYQKVRGSYAHQAIHLYNQNDLVEDTLDPTLRPYLEAYKKFCRESKGIIGVVDLKTGSPHPAVELQLAGYALLVNEGELKFKGGTAYEVQRYHPTWGYFGTPDIVIADKTPIRTVYALYLKDDGNYKLEDHSKNLRTNIQIFLSFTTTYKWRAERGLLT